MAVYRNSLVVFCTDKIVQITGSSAADFSLSTVTDDIGCLEPDTIQEVGGDVMFLAPDGVRTLSSTERIGDFGLPNRLLLPASYGRTQLALSGLAGVCAPPRRAHDRRQRSRRHRRCPRYLCG